MQNAASLPVIPTARHSALIQSALILFIAGAIISLRPSVKTSDGRLWCAHSHEAHISPLFIKINFTVDVPTSIPNWNILSLHSAGTGVPLIIDFK